MTVQSRNVTHKSTPAKRDRVTKGTDQASRVLSVSIGIMVISLVIANGLHQSLAPVQTPVSVPELTDTPLPPEPSIANSLQTDIALNMQDILLPPPPAPPVPSADPVPAEAVTRSVPSASPPEPPSPAQTSDVTPVKPVKAVKTFAALQPSQDAPAPKNILTVSQPVDRTPPEPVTRLTPLQPDPEPIRALTPQPEEKPVPDLAQDTEQQTLNTPPIKAQSRPQQDTPTDSTPPSTPNTHSPAPSDQTVVSPAQDRAQGAVALRLMEHGKGPGISVTWPTQEQERGQVWTGLTRCMGMVLAHIAPSNRLYRLEDPAGQAWALSSDRWSGYVRQVDYPATSYENQIFQQIKVRHNLPANSLPVRLFPRHRDSAWLGGLSRHIGRSLLAVKTVTATYAAQKNGIILTNIISDGTPAPGPVWIVPPGGC